MQHHIDIEEPGSGRYYSDQMVLVQFDLKLLEQFRLNWIDVWPPT